jgi:hypothetical protein
MSETDEVLRRLRGYISMATRESLHNRLATLDLIVAEWRLLDRRLSNGSELPTAWRNARCDVPPEES